MAARAAPMGSMKVWALGALAAALQSAWGVRLPRRGTTECKPDMGKLGRVRHCKVGKKEACPLEAMIRNGSYMVYPGGKTRCISNVMPHYAFQVIPKRTDRLIVVFDGGGACWDQLSLIANACNKQGIVPWPRTGMFSIAADNPYKDYSVLMVQYCSGDLHAGNVTQKWRDMTGRVVHQRGYHNTRSAIDWALKNFPGQLESLIITGTSAGAIGAQVWASTLLREFNYSSASIIADSYVGLFPPGFQGSVFQSLGVCGLDIIRPELQGLCQRGEITIADVFDHAIEEFPNVAFASLMSAHDEVQLDYYNKATLSMGKPNMSVSLPEFFEQAKSTFAHFDRHANFAVCIVQTSHHAFSSCEAFYTQGFTVGGHYHSVSDWFSQFTATGANRSLRSVCENGPDENRTCDAFLADKELVLSRGL